MSTEENIAPVKIACPCIASGCNKPSKGPRFKYLCQHHRAVATPEQIKNWQRLNKIDRKKGIKMKRAS